MSDNGGHVGRSTGDLAKRLEGLGLSTTGIRAVLRERLWKALEGNSSQIQKALDNHGGNRAVTVNDNNLVTSNIWARSVRIK